MLLLLLYNMKRQIRHMSMRERFLVKVMTRITDPRSPRPPLAHIRAILTLSFPHRPRRGEETQSRPALRRGQGALRGAGCPHDGKQESKEASKKVQAPGNLLRPHSGASVQSSYTAFILLAARRKQRKASLSNVLFFVFLHPRLTRPP